MKKKMIIIFFFSFEGWRYDRNCISQVAEAGFYEKDSFLFTVDGLFLFIPVIYNSLNESQSSTIGDYSILEDI